MWPKPGNLEALSKTRAFDWLIATHPPKAVKLEVTQRRPSGTATVESWRPRHIVLNIDALRRTILTVNHFYYPGWRGHIEGTNGQLAAYPSADGLIQVDVPEGQYNFVLELPRDGAERAGLLVSILSLLLVAVGGIWAWQKPSVERRQPHLAVTAHG